MSEALFPLELPEREWAEFPAAGFAVPVCGTIHRGSNPPVCGMPLGGIDTGCLDLECNGLLGFSTIFNSLVPRRGPLNLPFLGLSVGRQTWMLTTLDLPGRDLNWSDPYHGGGYRGPRTADEIHYWGHYPVADLEFVTDAPVEVGLRAWAPFLPGAIAESNTPGAAFEVHLRNPSSEGHRGTLAFSFPGPNEGEALTTHFQRVSLRRRNLKGLAVMSEKASYALGLIGSADIRVGGDLGLDGEAWAKISNTLPHAENQAGASLAVDFTIEPGQEKVIRFVLAWYGPQWMGGGTMTAGGNEYRHQYAARYHSVVDVAEFLVEGHESLLRRILAWQEVVYADEALPGWLKDSLVNVLHLIPETSVWAQARPPIGDWCRPEDGLFGMNESPRWCPQIECIPCSFYGNLPLVYFFPELALSTLRGYRAYQYPSGAAPWVFGGMTTGTPPYEMALPSPGYSHKPQTTLDGPCYVAMVDRLWQRTGDQALLHEFYDSVKRNTIFTMNLRPGSGAAGIVSMPTDNQGQDWFEHCDLFGIVPHIGGAHLAQLRMARRMAEAVGDDEFARQCQEWFEQGSAVLEQHTWADDHYLLFNELETGEKLDVVMAYTFDGEWMARSHGLEGVFQPDRVDAMLETFKRTSLAISEFGAAVFCKPEATELQEGEWDPGYWGAHGVHPPGTFMLAMTYMYRGQREFGLDLARRTVQEVLKRGWTYDWPVCIDSGVGPRVGCDYYQNLMLWSLPAALETDELSAPCREGRLVDRMIHAGK